MTPIDLLANLQGPSAVTGAPFGADLLSLGEALKRRGGLAVYVARDSKQADIAQKIAAFVDPTLEIVDLPSWDILPYDRVSPTPGVAAKRCAALAALAKGDLAAGRSVLAVTTASALVQRVPPKETMAGASLVVEAGGRVNEASLSRFLAVNGYARSSVVRERGEFAIRGGIVDLYPPTSLEPLRLDLFGDVLEQLRTFDPETQRSTGHLKHAVLAPVSEVLFSDEALGRFRERYLDVFGPPSGDPLFEALRAKRAALAKASAIPAYMIFHDGVLRAIASERPGTLDQLSETPGIGAKKLETYGAEFVSVVRQFENSVYRS